MKNVANKPPNDLEKVNVPPLHIKLGLMKDFVIGIKQNYPGFKYLVKKFPKNSDKI